MKKKAKNRRWQRLRMKRKSRRRRKEGSKEHWEKRTRKDTDSNSTWKRKCLCLLPRVTALRLAFTRSRMWALYVCTCTCGGKRAHRPWPFWSQRTRLLCSAGLIYSLLTHFILHQFIRIKQREAKKKETRSIEEKTLTAIENEMKESSSQKRRKQGALGKEDTKRHWQRLRMKKKEFVFTSEGVRPQACVFPLSYVGSLRVYMYMKSYKHTKQVGLRPLASAL